MGAAGEKEKRDIELNPSEETTSRRTKMATKGFLK